MYDLTTQIINFDGTLATYGEKVKTKDGDKNIEKVEQKPMSVQYVAEASLLKNVMGRTAEEDITINNADYIIKRYNLASKINKNKGKVDLTEEEINIILKTLSYCFDIQTVGFVANHLK